MRDHGATSFRRGRIVAGKTPARAGRSRARRRGPSLLRRLPWRCLARHGIALAAVVLGWLTLLSLILPGGRVSAPLRQGAALLFGWGALLVPLWLLGAGTWALVARLKPEALPPAARLVGAAGVTLALLGLLHLLLPAAQHGESAGGFVGYALGEGLVDLAGRGAALAVLLLTLATSALLALYVGPVDAARALILAGRLSARGAWALYRRARRPALRVNQPAAVTSLPFTGRRGGPQAVPLAAPAGEAAVGLPPAAAESLAAPAPATRSGWRLPPTTIFQPGAPAELSPGDVKQRARVIEETLASFGIDARVVEVNHGPALTQFGVEPAPGVAVNRILARSNDLALRLGVTPIRMEAPVPGKRVIGIEVPNITVSAVNIRGLLESPEFERIKSRLRIALGRDVTGTPVCADLARMPHLLIAGATGSGKSVCINSIIASLLVQCTPDELQFVMVDPKMVELAPFSGIPHLRMPVVTDMEQVVGALKWVVKEMERRYAACAARRVRNLEAYNRALQPGEKPLPYLVVVIDELADMMMTAADEVERTLCRLAQLGRAAGIHLVVATQRPSVDVITGLIKANFPTRISFAVSSQVDSRTILDMAGAEKLLGRGDMLYMPTDSSKPKRLQGAYVSDQEIQQLVEFWGRLGQPAYTEEEVRELEALGRGEAESDQDELYGKAVEVASQYQRISTSLLQRRLGIGYPRAARIIDLLEERGVIGPAEDGKSREVLAGRE